MLFKPAASILENYPDDWPPKEYFIDPHDVTKDQLDSLHKLIESSATEVELDTFLRNNLPVFACCLSFASTGHHGAWIIPQQYIRSPQKPILHGLKPDYIVGGQSSDGFFWYVVELKGANEQIFSTSEGRVYFSSSANKGVFQLLEYIDYCDEAQAYLRDTLRLKSIRRPRGLMLIGRELETQKDSNRVRLKAAWNRANRGTLEIRTYDALLRGIQRKITIGERV